MLFRSEALKGTRKTNLQPKRTRKGELQPTESESTSSQFGVATGLECEAVATVLCFMLTIGSAGQLERDGPGQQAVRRNHAVRRVGQETAVE